MVNTGQCCCRGSPTNFEGTLQVLLSFFNIQMFWKKAPQPEIPWGKNQVFNSNHIERLQKSPVKLETMDLICPCWTTIDVNRFYCRSDSDKLQLLSVLQLCVNPIIVLLSSPSQQQWLKNHKGASVCAIPSFIISVEGRAIFWVFRMSIFPQKCLYRGCARYRL